MKELELSVHMVLLSKILSSCMSTGHADWHEFVNAEKNKVQPKVHLGILIAYHTRDVTILTQSGPIFHLDSTV